MRKITGDGLGPGFSISEMKGTTDYILAQMAIDKFVRKDDNVRFCIPPCWLFEQIIHYLAANDRFDDKLLRALEKFTKYTYFRLVVPKIKEQLTDKNKLREKCKLLFKAMKDQEDWDQELSELLEISVDQLKHFKEGLRSYEDNSTVEQYLIHRGRNG